MNPTVCGCPPLAEQRSRRSLGWVAGQDLLISADAMRRARRLERRRLRRDAVIAEPVKTRRIAIRAAGAIANEREVIVIASQSVLGQFPDAPTALLVSAEADVFPKNHPELADLIDGSIGEGSSFHELYGYFARGVGEDTAVLPLLPESKVAGANSHRGDPPREVALRAAVGHRRVRTGENC